MKRMTSVHSFAFYTSIAFSLTGFILAFIISDHIRDDKMANLQELTSITIQTVDHRHLTGLDLKPAIPRRVADQILRDAVDMLKSDKIIKIMLVNRERTIISRTRQSDLAYRYGGEEVIVILPDYVKTDAGQIAQNIMDGLRSHDFSPYPSLTVSAGIAAKPEVATSLKRLIKASDSALLQAKQRGKNQMAVYSADANDI